MNLGQAIGRLLYPGSETPAPPQDVAPQTKRIAGGMRRSGGRRGEVLDLVRKRGSINCGELAIAMDITGTFASVLLHQLFCKEKKLQRTGDRLHYRYSMP